MQTAQQTLSKKSLRAVQKTPVILPVTRQDIEAALLIWGSNLVTISKTYHSGGDYKAVAKKLIQETYDYDHSTVLFKPTLASWKTFRTTLDGALSYFVGDNALYSEDRGFALNPWEKVEFEIAGVILGENHGLVMGNKHLRDSSGKVTVANFTMGFLRNEAGQLKINVHHSSLPYLPT